ncbi:hypothetical protein FJQ98_12875 [Lysinibacillus agricola]|uniref:Lipoprotein n=1 Tax=Lysinibacillus agricola TaxID=2590012 RepID=A0ABX7AKE0_9BACI|nr:MULTISPECIES: hypothetical protein [Lysinibacillus]KOS64118.1 hypothetical protein AN161_03675 [Lysinibacillus sp. FJAT-14222]QQP10208.1 hypothetical protein FJQ98_12875 [Lysinibacillus agricola]
MRLNVFVLSFALLLVGCSEENNTEPVDQLIPTVLDKAPEVKQHPVEQQKNEKAELASFFPPDGSTAYFQGEGNEFASFTLQTSYIDANYIAQMEDNGAVTILKVYRITDLAIELIYKEAVNTKPILPTAQEAASFPVIETILQKPLKAGNSFNGWTIQSTTASTTTGITVYRDVIKLTRSEGSMTTTKYFVKNIGLIRTEDTMKTNNKEPFVITSTLQKIE